MKNIYLIGMMGCGKTTCAGLLAGRLGREWLDTDDCIERAAGMTVSQIFSARGEPGFRDLETDLCRDLSRRENLIVACGGGLPLREENRALIRTGLVVFLNRDPEEIYDSVDMSARPLGQAGKDAFLARFSRRAPIYRAAAHIVIEQFASPEKTVEEIMQKLEEYL